MLERMNKLRELNRVLPYMPFIMAIIISGLAFYYSYGWKGGLILEMIFLSVAFGVGYAKYRCIKGG